MFTAAPLTGFLSLVVLELVIVVCFLLGMSAAGSLLHRHERMAVSLD